MSFSEFYANTGTGNEDNRNGGSDRNAATVSTNGAYTQGGGAGGGTKDLFAAAAGTPFSGRAVGDYVAVMNDGTSGTTPFIGRVTAINGGGVSIDIDSTKSSGTRPTTAGSGVTVRVGGPWIGPTGATAFPFGFITAAATDGSGNAPRVNGAGTSNITAAMTHANAGPIRFQGMTASPGDLGKWTIDGGTSGASYSLLTVSGADNDLLDLIAQNNGASGSAAGVTLTGARVGAYRCVVHDVRGNGFALGGAVQDYLEECEAYACNQSNTANLAGFLIQSSQEIVRCISHDNTGSNSHGFLSNNSGNCPTYVGCIADTNGGDGFRHTAAGGTVFLLGCDSYNNGSDGVDAANASSNVTLRVENCNFLKNAGYGVNGSGAGTRSGRLVNNGFGSGTQANTSGTTTGLGSTEETGSVTYASGVTPWVDPANGDFRINLSAAKGVGRGSFTETQGGYTGTVAFPDIGAGQSKGGGFVLVEDD
jgi:hypothetical protein